MKWGRGVFFVKKVENGGAFYVKKWTFPQRRVHYVQYQYSLFYILLIWRGVRTHQTHPSAYGPVDLFQRQRQASIVRSSVPCDPVSARSRDRPLRCQVGGGSVGQHLVAQAVNADQLLVDVRARRPSQPTNRPIRLQGAPKKRDS